MFGSMPNILDKISELCEHRFTHELRTIQQLDEIGKVASHHAEMLTQILFDYIKKNESTRSRSERARIRAARKMLGEK